MVNTRNYLPNHVVLAESTHTFKSRLDNNALNQDIISNCKSEITGTGSLSTVSYNF